MVRSVEEILQKEFGRSLSDRDVHILDPFVGTGNFVTRVMREIRTSALPYKFENELHCNELMLLPYYIASMNIEHEYLDRTGEYKPFPGICLVDTFELAEPKQTALFTEENTQRVERQKRAPVFAIVSNPPYNAGQVNENDNNKNRKYPEIDRRVNQSYAKASRATNKNALSNPYVKAFRWASDRIGENGVVAFVSDNSFLDDVSFDGMRAHLAKDFSAIYHLNLKGNARTAGERRRREGGNVFLDQIRVSVGITFLVRSRARSQTDCEVWVHSVDDFLRAGQKIAILENAGTYQRIPWERMTVDARHTWLTRGMSDNYESLAPLGVKKRGRSIGTRADSVFDLFSNGNDSGRDSWVYNFDKPRRTRSVSRIRTTWRWTDTNGRAVRGTSTASSFPTSA